MYRMQKMQHFFSERAGHVLGAPPGKISGQISLQVHDFDTANLSTDHRTKAPSRPRPDYPEQAVSRKVISCRTCHKQINKINCWPQLLSKHQKKKLLRVIANKPYQALFVK